MRLARRNFCRAGAESAGAARDRVCGGNAVTTRGRTSDLAGPARIRHGAEPVHKRPKVHAAGERRPDQLQAAELAIALAGIAALATYLRRRARSRLIA